MDKLFEKYILEPVQLVKSELLKQGYKVSVEKCSKPKIKTDSELVISIKSKPSGEVVILAGDFLIKI